MTTKPTTRNHFLREPLDVEHVAQLVQFERALHRRYEPAHRGVGRGPRAESPKGDTRIMNTLSLMTEGDRFVVGTRRFDASPADVYRAHVEPAWIQRWLLGPEGWTMPVCVFEAKPGGKIRYEWSDRQGGDFYLTGEIIELDPPNRIVHVERMHLPDPTPDNHVVTTFSADGSGTLMTVRMTLPDAATREAMLATGMEHGMEASYARLESVIEASVRAGHEAAGTGQ